jgi:hypothetical protein
MMQRLGYSTFFENLTLDEIGRVENILSRTQRGFGVDLVTPLVSRDDTTSGRESLIHETDLVTMPTGYGWLDEAELEQRGKIGPFSIMLPYEQRKDQVHSYFEQGVPMLDPEAAEYATKRLLDLVPFHSLVPISLEDAFDQMPNNTNLGWPWMTSDKEYRPMVLERARTIKASGYQQSVLDPAMLFWRGQPRGLNEPPKQRTVWGFPHAYTLMELSLQKPILHELIRYSDFSAWVGSDAVDMAITILLKEAKFPVLSVDFSGYDASVPGAIIREVFRVIKMWFKTRYTPLIEFVERVFLEIPLATPEGVLVGRSGGIPSGDGMTNTMGGLIQKWSFHYAAHRMRNSIREHLVQGDDGVVSFAQAWNPDDLEDIMISELCLRISAEKGAISRDRVVYLQNHHSLDYLVDDLAVGVRPIFRVLNGAMSYERLRRGGWTGYADTIRWIQQWENARHHPSFPEFVELLVSWDKFLRELPIDLILKRAGGLEKIESLLGDKSFPFGKEPISRVNEFATVRLIRKILHRD